MPTPFFINTTGFGRGPHEPSFSIPESDRNYYGSYRIGVFTLSKMKKGPYVIYWTFKFLIDYGLLILSTVFHIHFLMNNARLLDP